MKSVKVTMTFEFETEDVDDDTLKEAIVEAFEEKSENDELLDKKTKIKITDLEADDDEPSFEDEDDED
jgi:L-lactate utilization protein LutC